MNHAKLLDCTLRDGAYLIDKNFGDTAIHGIVNGLMDAKIDMIEIGFLQDDGFGEGKTVFKNGADAERFVPRDKRGCEFTVLADYSRYSIDNLDECTGRSFDGVRACFFKQEREAVLDFCRGIKAKGYKLFVQPVDILGYTDVEIIDLIEKINGIEPYCFSIVDTFGSMYVDDLERVYSLIHHNLAPGVRVGFHSHNNLQMSNALSQQFVRMTYGQREIVVDTTLCGMGRGAGNTPTELVAQYMTSRLGYPYDIDAILDVIDGYMDNIRTRCSWGYTTPYFIAGCYSAHVNNIAYLTQKSSIRSRDIRYILNKIGPAARKRYDYEALENTYLEYLHSDIDDSAAIDRLAQAVGGRNVLLLAPGRSSIEQGDRIRRYVEEHDAVVIAVNFLHETIPADFVFISNVRRFQYYSNVEAFRTARKILTSNIVPFPQNDRELVVSFTRLIKCGWTRVDNAALMLLRLLDRLNVASVGIAGMDGYGYLVEGANYASSSLELSNVRENPLELNREIREMLQDFAATREGSALLRFVTSSRFEDVFAR